MFKYIPMDIEYCGFNNPRGICQNIILQDVSTHEFYIKPKILNLKVSWANNIFYTQYSTLQVKGM
jgi:hypothetical protein